MTVILCSLLRGEWTDPLQEMSYTARCLTNKVINGWCLSSSDLICLQSTKKHSTKQSTRYYRFTNSETIVHLCHTILFSKASTIWLIQSLFVYVECKTTKLHPHGHVRQTDRKAGSQSAKQASHQVERLAGRWSGWQIARQGCKWTARKADQHSDILTPKQSGRVTGGET